MQLKSPHRVISTDLIAKTPEEPYHDLICKEIALDPVHVAFMGTAANVNPLGRRGVEFKDYVVDAFVTAGVEGNRCVPAIRPFGMRPRRLVLL